MNKTETNALWCSCEKTLKTSCNNETDVIRGKCRESKIYKRIQVSIRAAQKTSCDWPPPNLRKNFRRLRQQKQPPSDLRSRP